MCILAGKTSNKQGNTQTRGFLDFGNQERGNKWPVRWLEAGQGVGLRQDSCRVTLRLDLSNEYEKPWGRAEPPNLSPPVPLPSSPPNACLSTGAARFWFSGSFLQCSVLGYLYQSTYHMELPLAFIFPPLDLNYLRVRTYAQQSVTLAFTS